MKTYDSVTAINARIAEYNVQHMNGIVLQLYLKHLPTQCTTYFIFPARLFGKTQLVNKIIILIVILSNKH